MCGDTGPRPVVRAGADPAGSDLAARKNAPLIAGHDSVSRAAARVTEEGTARTRGDPAGTEPCEEMPVTLWSPGVGQQELGHRSTGGLGLSDSGLDMGATVSGRAVPVPVDNRSRHQGGRQAFGATFDRPLMMRSIASPPVGSVRLASIFRVNFIRIGCVRPRCVAIFMTFGLPIIFTKARPSV